MINVGIVGVTGYAGEELLDILLGHPEVRVTCVQAKLDGATAIDELFPRFDARTTLTCTPPDTTRLISRCELVFLALPHTVSMEFVRPLLKAGKRVIDLSADYRLKESRVYERHYKVRHKDSLGLKQAVYGLPELYRAKIKGARLIANPGCYPTAAILACAPLVSCGLVDRSSIIIDAKSGTTGAGRKMAGELLSAEVNEDFRAYKVGVHQHAPEIDQVLSAVAGKKLAVTFVPHLLPLNRGILETVYLRRKKGASHGSLFALYQRFYKSEPFVRIKREGAYPRLKDVVMTNYCDIAVKALGEQIIVISAIDNLLKGASGQAVQNMNIMYGFPEKMGLR